MHITLKQLTVFIEVAKDSHISAAAERLHLSQSAASMALSELERQLNVKLFERQGKKLKLSEHGKKLLPLVDEVLTKAKSIEQFKLAPSNILQGELNIGASSTVGNYLLPQIIAGFKQLHPEIKISLSISNTQHVIEELDNYKIDLGFIEGECNNPTLISQPWSEDRLVIFAANKNPLAKKLKLTWDDVLKCHWIGREKGSGTREMFEAGMKKSRQQKINYSFELNSNEAVKEMVMLGDGIACLSELAITRELKNKQLVLLPLDFKVKRKLLSLVQQKKYQSPLLKAFLAFSQK